MINKNSYPKFSMLLSVYKRDNVDFLNECIESIFNQTIFPDEILIIQEGDVSKELTSVLDFWIQKFNGILKVYKIPFQNGPMGFGLPASLNYGISVANYEYIARMDTDDICVTNRIEIQKKYAYENPEVSLFGSNIEEYDQYMIKKTGNRNVPYNHSEIIKYSKYRNAFNGPTVVFKKNIAIKLGGYPIVASNEDYCFWALFILNNYKITNQDYNLVKMRGGDEILHRRSSKRYRQGEVDSLLFLKNINFFSQKMFIFHLISKFFIRRMPLFFIRKIYKRLR